VGLRMKKVSIVLFILLIMGFFTVAFAVETTNSNQSIPQSQEETMEIEEVRNLPSTLIISPSSGEESITPDTENNLNPWEIQYMDIPSDIDLLIK